MAESDSSSDQPPKRKKRLALFAVLGVLLFALAGAGGAVLALGPDRVMALLTGGEAAEEEATPPEPGSPEDIAARKAKQALVEIMPLDEMIVNITAITATGRRTSRFLKLNVALAVDPEAEGAERVADREPYLRDSVQDFLRHLTEDDLQGSAGLALLKTEILRRAREVTDSEAPREVLLSDLVIQ
ncbi:flagellar basal body-associated FliL family protein [Roseivivax sp.]